MTNKTLYHIWLFLFGIIYYLIVPVLVIASRIWEDYPGIHILYSYYRGEYMLGYLLLVLFVTIPFFVGAYLPIYYYRGISRPIHQYIINSRGLLIISIPLLLYGQYVIFSNRANLFQGYQIEADAPYVGTLVTINMFFLFLFLYNKFGNYSKHTNIIITLILIELCVVVVSFGTRMYAMVTIVSILTYLLDQKLVSLKKILLWLSIIIIFLLAVGIWRLGGDTNISFEQMIFIGIAEPTFTWISAISMYDLNELPFIAIPSNFVSSFINFIPLSLFPNKSELISELSLNFDAPLGATSVLLSLLSNFGIIGSAIAIFCLGFLLSQVRLHWKTAFGQTYYYCICGLIPFQLFRDEFGIVNKQLFSNFLLFPILIFLVHRVLSLLATKVE